MNLNFMARITGCRRNACHQQMIAGTGSGDVKEMAFRIVDLFQVRIVGYHLDFFLTGYGDPVRCLYRDRVSAN